MRLQQRRSFFDLLVLSVAIVALAFTRLQLNVGVLADDDSSTRPIGPG